MIRTVTGCIAPNALGFCQPHEHIYACDTPAAARNPALRIDDEALSVLEAMDYRAAGGDSLIDCQPLGAGRDIYALKRISQRSGVNIIAVTGYHMPIFYPEDHWIYTDSEVVLTDRFIAELSEGARDEENNTVFPGAVKAAIGAEGPTGRFRMCLRAAARAAAEAHVPLILHTEAGTGAVEAVKLCEGVGLDPARMAVCHVDRQAVDYRIHEAVACTGACLEYDTVARYKYHDDASEVTLIRHMLSKGWSNRLMISLDTTAARLARYGGSPGLGYICQTFIPMLMQAGVSKAEVDAMTRDNPRILFE